MSSVEVIKKTEAAPQAEPIDMKLEVVLLEVSDVDRAKAFYENVGWRLDIDLEAGDFRAVQVTPHNSEASIIFGKRVTAAKRGSAASLVLAVDDVDAARDDLIARGVEVSEVFHYAGGPFNNAVENPRVGGRDPQGRSYFSFATFEDPDGNEWLLQEIQTREHRRNKLVLAGSEKQHYVKCPRWRVISSCAAFGDPLASHGNARDGDPGVFRAHTSPLGVDHCAAAPTPSLRSRVVGGRRLVVVPAFVGLR